MPAGVRALRARLAAAPLRQPDALSCGACVAEVATAVHGGTTPPGPPTFATVVVARHRQLTSARDVAGRPQVPWPRFWGTPPWALARHLTRTTGRAHRVVWARTGTGRATRAISRALAAGAPVPLYVGSRALPRHVLLALPAADADGDRGETWTVYDPAPGQLRELSVPRWRARQLDTGWPRPWLAIVPREVIPARRAAGRTRA